MFRLMPRWLGRSGRADSRAPIRRRLSRPALETLEDRTLLSAMPQFNLANPASGGTFGSQVVVLSTGNIVVTDPTVNGNAGAVYLFDGASGGLISTLSGNAGDQVGSGGVTVLTNGNYVVTDPAINNNTGAVYLVNGASGAMISTLSGSAPGDSVGSGGVTALGSGNFVVADPAVNNNAGAVNLINGVSGAVISTLSGSAQGDKVGSGGVTALTNGNYVISSPLWNGHAGAVTWGSATAGVSGPVSATNSLTGTGALIYGTYGAYPPLDVGYYADAGVVALTNGNYLVVNSYALTHRGAVTWGNGTTGIVGTVSDANSLVGATAGVLFNQVPLSLSEQGFIGWNGGDLVGSGGARALANGNYVVDSPLWNGNQGAATWADGATGLTGTVSAANSLTGSSAGDQVGGNGITALANGNYVVESPFWGAYVGAVTWGNGASGTAGAVSAANSLVGTTDGDLVGSNGVAALTNGNYVVESPVWGSYRGAATWGNGASGTAGVVSASNSLVGGVGGDVVASAGVVPLTNGNYVVVSPDFAHEFGAVTWSNGTTGVTGIVSAANSVVGDRSGDLVGSGGVTALVNGNYVLVSPNWHVQTGAATWGNGSTGATGTVSVANSLVGSSSGDLVGGTESLSFAGVSSLPDGNYVVLSSFWSSRLGAATWGNGTSGVSGPVSAANSLVGTTPSNSSGSGGDEIGSGGLTVLPSSNYIVVSPRWNGSAGAATWAGGADGVTLDGANSVDAQNSLVGAMANASPDLKPIVLGPRSGTFIASFTAENGGRLTVGEPEFDASLNGTTPGNGSGSTYTQLVVSGPYNVGGAQLVLSSIGGFAVGQAFAIIKSSQPIMGTFAGLPEGAPVVAGGQTYKISYLNNQVTLYAAPAITFSPSPLPAGTTGAAYNQTLTGSGGTAPYGNFLVSAGTLPPGLMLSTGGTISGTPTATGAFTFTLQATDSSAAPGPYPALQTFTLVVTPPGFSYNSTTQVLTITSSSGGNSFTFTQAAGGIDSFVLNGTPFSLPESLLSTVQVNVAGTGNVASFSTLGEVAPEAIRVGNGGGRVQHLDAQGIPHDFLIATGFQNTSAAVTHADQGFIDSTPGVKNVFVGAGIYSYMNTGNNAEDFYYITGAKFVYGYASGPGDFAYQYDGSGPSYYTVSGVAYSIMFGTDAGVIFQNYAMGFVFNEGIANHPGQDTATFYDSPSNDQFTGFTYYSSMTSANGTFAENDVAVYFAQVYAYSFVGGFDRATVYDANVNHVFGFH